MAVLALVAAFAAPVRQACGSSCIEADAAAAIARTVEPPAGSCHKPEAPPEPRPSPEHCTHDHSASLQSSTRVAAASDADGAADIARAIAQIIHIASVTMAPADPNISPGSPPIRIITLRI